uniref:Madanin 3 n=1 Tax=Hyalomma rufipes TaxID=72862 RepID=E2J6R9_HYARU
MSKLLVVLLLVAIVAEMIKAKPNLQSRNGDGVAETSYEEYPDDSTDNSGGSSEGSDKAVPRLPSSGSGHDSDPIPVPVN